jgi:hypothetical protein
VIFRFCKAAENISTYAAIRLLSAHIPETDL